MSDMTFPESTTQSLYCCLVCLSQTLLLCRILSLVHTQLLLTCQLQYIVIVMQISTLIGQAPSHYVMVSLQVNMILTQMVNVLLIFHLGDNIGIVLWTQGMSQHS